MRPSSSCHKGRAEGNLSITLGDGSQITIPVQNSLNLSLSTSLNLTITNLGQELKIGYDVTGSKADEAIVAIAEAKSVKAKLDKTAKEVSVSFDSDFSSGHLIMMATDLDKATVLRPVFFNKAKETKILISTADELVAFAQNVNAQDGTENMDIYLEKDIDISSIKDWTPIGNGTFSGTAVSGAAFKGTFHGQNHTIKGMNITVPADAAKGASYGLFGVLDGATVKDLDIGEGSSITSSAKLLTCGGAIAGSVVNELSIIAPHRLRSTFPEERTTSAQVRRNSGFCISAGEVIAQVTNSSNFGIFKSVNTTNSKNGGTAFSIGGVVGYAESASSALQCDDQGLRQLRCDERAGLPQRRSRGNA